ncbi:MAG: acylphosphatase [Phycisphaerae bacterium]
MGRRSVCPLIAKWSFFVGIIVVLSVLGGLRSEGPAKPSRATSPATVPAGALVRVSSSEQLAEAIRSAKAGDTILVAPGSYSLSAEVGAAPLTIQAADTKDRPILSPADGPYVLDIKDMDGAVTIRNILFDGQKKKVGAIQARNTRLEVEDCELRDFWGISAVIVSTYGKDPSAHKGLRVSRCVFRRNPNGEKDSDACGSAVNGNGPAIVEDCTIEDIRGGLVFRDETGRAGSTRRDYKVIIRRNHIYRTEGTDWKCHAIVTRTTAPEVYDNVIHDLSKRDCSAMTIASNGLDAKGTPTAAMVYRNVIIEKWKAADSGFIHEGIEYGEYRPSKGKIFENLLVGYVSPGLYNKGDQNEWYNNTLVFAKSEGSLYHCYGLKCKYYNTIQVGGKASMNNEKAMDKAHGLGPECTSEDHALEFSCLWKAANTFLRGQGYFEADPKFVDPANMDFHLRYDSPCINKGTGSRDGLTPTDLGAFEYPIQVCQFKVDAAGKASWQWANDFQKVSKRVKVRWNGKSFPPAHDREGDVTVADVDASQTTAVTGKTSGYFAAFVLDAKDRWSGPTPDGVHQFTFEATTSPATAPTSGPTSQTAIERLHVFVSGRVQGVGFRDFTKGQADALGVTGWVRNLDDGRVEAVLEGSSDKVGKLLEKIRQGPPSAKVDGVEVERAAHTGEFKGFVVKR